jgi:hypothetical protein
LVLAHDGESSFALLSGRFVTSRLARDELLVTGLVFAAYCGGIVGGVTSGGSGRGFRWGLIGGGGGVAGSFPKPRKDYVFKI